MWERFGTYFSVYVSFTCFLFLLCNFQSNAWKERGEDFLVFLIPTGLPWNQCYPKQGQCTGQWTVKIWLIFSFFFWPHSTACGISVPRCSSVDNLCSALCDSMDFSTPGFPVLHHLPELTQTQVHWIRATIQPSHPLLLPSPAFNLSQHRGLFQWVSSLHLIAKVSDLQLQDQSFQWIFRVDFL